MKLRPLVLSLYACLLAGPAAAQAQLPAALALRESAAFRQSLVAGIRSGAIDSPAAIEQLRTRARPIGLENADPTFEFALASLDVGRGLVGANHPKEAEPFFTAGEAALTALLEREGLEIGLRVQGLKQRANLRMLYLGKPAEAVADLDAARALRPDDARLKRLRESLVRERAQTQVEQEGKR